VAVNLNPDPSGGHWREPPLSDRHWYPLYEALVGYDVPAMIHVSTSCNPCFHTTGAHYLNADTTAFMQCLTSLREHLLNNVFFDTCVYHQPGIDLLATVIPADNILFASEMIGAVRGVDPETGFNYDDTRRYVEASRVFSADDRVKVYERNARRVYPRLDAALRAQGR
jgi:4-oxalmesaconate hydratase